MNENVPHMESLWGWRGVLGHISPSVFAMMGRVFYQVVPEGVGLMVVTLGMNEPSATVEVDRALAGVEQAARQLAQGNPNFIFLGGLPLSIGKGLGHDKEIIKRIEAVSGIPATTSITAAMDAFRALSIKKLVVANPSPPELKKRYKEYLEGNGFQVLGIGGPEFAKNSDKRQLPPHTPYAAARKLLLEAPEADGVYIPCGSWSVGPAIVEFLERDLGKPVVTSDQAFIWAGLKALRIREPVKGFGQLFQTL